MNAADDIIICSTLALPRIDTPSSVTTPENENDSPGVIDSFALFPTLPLELRRKVWGHTITPRNVEIRFDIITTSHKHDFVADQPIILYVCHESREEGLRAYKLELHTEHSQNKVYFNYDLDTLYFREVWQPNALHFAGDTTPQRINFVKGLPSKDKIRHLTTVRQDRDFWIFPALEQRGHTEHIHVNNDGDCKICNFNVRPNRTYFLGKQEERHVYHHLETSKRKSLVTEEEFAPIYDKYVKAMEFTSLVESLWTQSYPWKLLPRIPLPTIEIHSVFISHITEEQIYCKHTVGHRGVPTFDESRGENE
jgi:hypothetical protein